MQENPDKGRIVNQRHFERLQGLLKNHGGQVGNAAILLYRYVCHGAPYGCVLNKLQS